MIIGFFEYKGIYTNYPNHMIKQTNIQENNDQKPNTTYNADNRKRLYNQIDHYTVCMFV